MRSCDDPGRPPGGADLRPLAEHISIKSATCSEQTLKVSDKENAHLEPFEDKASSRRRCRRLCVWWLHSHLLLFSQQPGRRRQRFSYCDFWGRGQLIHVDEAAIYGSVRLSVPRVCIRCLHQNKKPTALKCELETYSLFNSEERQVFSSVVL